MGFPKDWVDQDPNAREVRMDEVSEAAKRLFLGGCLQDFDFWLEIEMQTFEFKMHAF